VLEELAALRPRELAQTEMLDDRADAQIEDTLDASLDLLVRDRAGAERLDVHADGPGPADGVAELHLARLGEPCRDDVLRDVTSGVRADTVDAPRVFAAERGAAVARELAVGVDRRLPARQACVESPGRRCRCPPG
jgi:hypothetical protein